eukprot:2365023-Pyramimonas_sp.AAC.1
MDTAKKWAAWSSHWTSTHTSKRVMVGMLHGARHARSPYSVACGKSLPCASPAFLVATVREPHNKNRNV